MASLIGLNSVSQTEENESQGPNSAERIRCNSGPDAYNQMEKQNISFQQALYQHNQYSFEGLSHISGNHHDPEASQGNYNV